MATTPPRVVFDCNVYLQAILSHRGPAFACVRLALISRVSLVTSPQVLDELRRMPAHPAMSRFSHVTPSSVEAFIIKLAPIAISLPSVPSVFEYSRDPKDAHYIDLAVAAQAVIITSRDRDLLDLMSSPSRESVEFRQRFPDLRILPPETLLREVRS